MKLFIQISQENKFTQMIDFTIKQYIKNFNLDITKETRLFLIL